MFAVRFCIFCEQSIDYSLSDESLTLQRVETWTVMALKEYVKKRGLSVTGPKKLLADRKYVVRFSSLML